MRENTIFCMGIIQNFIAFTMSELKFLEGADRKISGRC